jgi:hypothetical protein
MAALSWKFFYSSEAGFFHKLASDGQLAPGKSIAAAPAPLA